MSSTVLRSDFRWPFLLALLLAMSICCPLRSAQPNILLIMADDLRNFGGAFTEDVVKTPQLARLRSHGTTFERAYVQYPVCNPSRSSLLSGLRPDQTGILGNDIRLRERLPDIVTLPQLCKDHGYQAHAFGKITHLGGGRDSRLQQQWMDTGLSWHTATAYSPTARGQKLVEGRNVTGDALNWCRWGAAEGSDDDQPDGQIAAATIAKIEELTKQQQPWIIGCGFMKPHDPFIAPKKYFDLYPLESLKLWQDPANTSASPPQAVGFGDFGKAFNQFTEKEWRELFRAYLAGTSFMDAQLGRVLDALDRHHLWESTIVIFVGDHGYHTGERRWWNKNTLYERSCRAPLIICAPGSRGGQISRSLVEFVDLYPTLCNLCSLKAPHPLAGTSLTPVLQNPTATVKQYAFTQVSRGAKAQGRSVRSDKWRYTRWTDGSEELYDHTSDPEECHNVAASQPTIVAELSAKLSQP